MRCPGCNTENPDDSKFCGTCGQTLPASAPPLPAPVISPTAPTQAPAPASAPAPRKPPENPPAFEPPPPPKERPDDDSDDPFSKISKARKGTAVLEKNDAQPEPGAPGAASKSHVLCAGCKGAFPAGTLKKVDGELLCDMCINLKEKTRKKPKASPAPFGSSPAGLVQPESNPDVPFQPRASQKAPSVNAPMSGAMMAVIVIAVVALLGLVGFGFMMAFAK